MSFPPGTEMFQFPGFAPPPYGFGRRYPRLAARVGCPIRRSPDQSLLAAPRGLSQRATSFVASWRQGIHQMPLLPSAPPSGNRAAAPPPRAHAPAGSKVERRRPREGAKATNTRKTTSIPMPNLPPRPKTERPEEEERGSAACLPTPARGARREKGGSSPPLSPAPAARRAPLSHHHTMCKERTDGRTHAPAGPRASGGRAGGGLVGLGRLERPTSRLSGVRSDRLSYRPGGRPGLGRGRRSIRHPSVVSGEGTRGRRRGPLPRATGEGRPRAPALPPGARAGLRAGMTLERR